MFARQTPHERRRGRPVAWDAQLIERLPGESVLRLRCVLGDGSGNDGEIDRIGEVFVGLADDFFERAVVRLVIRSDMQIVMPASLQAGRLKKIRSLI